MIQRVYGWTGSWWGRLVSTAIACYFMLEHINAYSHPLMQEHTNIHAHTHLPYIICVVLT